MSPFIWKRRSVPVNEDKPDVICSESIPKTREAATHARAFKILCSPGTFNEKRPISSPLYNMVNEGCAYLSYVISVAV